MYHKRLSQDRFLEPMRDSFFYYPDGKYNFCLDKDNIDYNIYRIKNNGLKLLALEYAFFFKGFNRQTKKIETYGN